VWQARSATAGRHGVSGKKAEDLSKLAARMRREQQTLRALMQTLRKHVADVPDLDRDDWLRGLRHGFERLRVHLRQMFECQQEGGYLREVLDLQPTLAKQVECICCEHDQLLRMAERIAQDLEQTGPQDNLLVADACARVARFMAVVDQHQQRENTIALVVFNRDLGTCD